MASISEQLTQAALAQPTVPSKRDPVAGALKIAQFMQKAQNDRAQLDQQKQVIGLKHFENFNNAVKRRREAKTAGQRKLNTQQLDVTFALAFPDANPETLEVFKQDDELARKYTSILNNEMFKAGGKLTPEVYAAAQDKFKDDQIGLTTFLEKRHAEDRSLEKARITAAGQFARGDINRQERRQIQINKDVAGIVKQFDTLGIVEARETFRDIDKLIPGGIDRLGPESKRGIPGFGVIAGKSPIAFTAEGRELRQSVFALRNAALKAGGGKALTETEKALFTEVLGVPNGLADFKTEKELIDGIRIYRRFLNARIENLGQGLTAEARAEAERRKISFAPVSQKSAKAAGAGKQPLTLDIFNKLDKNRQEDLMSKMGANSIDEARKLLGAK